MRACTSKQAPYSPTSQNDKEGASRGERAPILVVFPLDCVDEGVSCMVRCIFHVGADARHNEGDVE